MSDDDVTVQPRRLWGRNAIMAVGCASAIGVIGASVAAHAGRPSHNDRRVVEIGDLPSNARLAAFASLPREEDRAPASLVATIGGLEGGPDVPANLRNGTIDPAGSRLLLKDASVGRHTLYAFPSAKGYTCYALVGGPQSCHRGFTPEQPIGLVLFDEDGLETGAPTTIFGLVPNNVEALQIRVEGVWCTPVMGRNAYVLELPDQATGPDEVVVTFRSGKSTTITFR